jgi:hypothetical protein
MKDYDGNMLDEKARAYVRTRLSFSFTRHASRTAICARSRNSIVIIGG